MKTHSFTPENSEPLPYPTYGNEEMETLLWDNADGETDFVICPVCGTRYNPFTGKLRWPT